MQGKTSLVVTILGPDRPGIVESLAQAVAAQEASWQESRMVHLAGRFAGVVRAEVASERADALGADLRALESQGLRVAIEAAGDAPEPDAPASGAFELALVCNDRPGIVREISSALAKRRVNVEELHTECGDAPISGGMLFRATARLQLPSDLTPDDLREVLEGIATDVMVDLRLEQEGADLA